MTTPNARSIGRAFFMRREASGFAPYRVPTFARVFVCIGAEDAGGRKPRVLRRYRVSSRDTAQGIVDRG